MQVHRPITVDDLDSLELPERWELIGGEVVEMSPSGTPASWIGLYMASRLLEATMRSGRGFALGADGGFVLDPAGTILLCPDASYTSGERGGDRRKPGFVRVSPDIAVEVLSPSDRMVKATEKAMLYLNAGTTMVWLVHPERRTVTVFTQDDPPVTLVGDAVLTGGDVLPEFRMALSEIFGD